MSTLTCFDADPDLRTMVHRIADCARHQGGHHTSDYLAGKLARFHDDAVETRHIGESGVPSEPLTPVRWKDISLVRDWASAAR
jgi:hypothetical protein